MKKNFKNWQIENSGKSEISKKLFHVFDFALQPIENSDLKFLEKILRDFQDFDLARENRPYQEAIMKILWNKTVK